MGNHGATLQERPSSVDCLEVEPILHDAAVLPDGDADLLEMVQDTFDKARQVLGSREARAYIRAREDDLYRHLEGLGLDHSLPRVRAVYAAFWRRNAGM